MLNDLEKLVSLVSPRRSRLRQQHQPDGAHSASPASASPSKSLLGVCLFPDGGGGGAAAEEPPRKSLACSQFPVKPQTRHDLLLEVDIRRVIEAFESVDEHDMAALNEPEIQELCYLLNIVYDRRAFHILLADVAAATSAGATKSTIGAAGSPDASSGVAVARENQPLSSSPGSARNPYRDENNNNYKEQHQHRTHAPPDTILTPQQASLLCPPAPPPLQIHRHYQPAPAPAASSTHTNTPASSFTHKNATKNATTTPLDVFALTTATTAERKPNANIVGDDDCSGGGLAYYYQAGSAALEVRVPRAHVICALFPSYAKAQVEKEIAAHSRPPAPPQPPADVPEWVERKFNLIVKQKLLRSNSATAASCSASGGSCSHMKWKNSSSNMIKSTKKRVVVASVPSSSSTTAVTGREEEDAESPAVLVGNDDDLYVTIADLAGHTAIQGYLGTSSSEKRYAAILEQMVLDASEEVEALRRNDLEDFKRLRLKDLFLRVRLPPQLASVVTKPFLSMRTLRERGRGLQQQLGPYLTTRQRSRLGTVVNLLRLYPTSQMLFHLQWPVDLELEPPLFSIDAELGYNMWGQPRHDFNVDLSRVKLDLKRYSAMMVGCGGAAGGAMRMTKRLADELGPATPMAPTEPSTNKVLHLPHPHLAVASAKREVELAAQRVRDHQLQRTSSRLNAIMPRRVSQALHRRASVAADDALASEEEENEKEIGELLSLLGHTAAEDKRGEEDEEGGPAVESSAEKEPVAFVDRAPHKLFTDDERHARSLIYSVSQQTSVAQMPHSEHLLLGKKLDYLAVVASTSDYTVCTPRDGCAKTLPSQLLALPEAELKKEAKKTRSEILVDRQRRRKEAQAAAAATSHAEAAAIHDASPRRPHTAGQQQEVSWSSSQGSTGPASTAASAATTAVPPTSRSPRRPPSAAAAVNAGARRKKNNDGAQSSSSSVFPSGPEVSPRRYVARPCPPPPPSPVGAGIAPRRRSSSIAMIRRSSSSATFSTL